MTAPAAPSIEVSLPEHARALVRPLLAGLDHKALACVALAVRAPAMPAVVPSR